MIPYSYRKSLTGLKKIAPWLNQKLASQTDITGFYDDKKLLTIQSKIDENSQFIQDMLAEISHFKESEEYSQSLHVKSQSQFESLRRQIEKVAGMLAVYI